MTPESQLRAEIVEVGRRMYSRGYTASNDGNIIALETKTGRYLWHYYTGAKIITSPISYAVDGKQYVAIASQSAIFVFGLP